MRYGEGRVRGGIWGHGPGFCGLIMGVSGTLGIWWGVVRLSFVMVADFVGGLDGWVRVEEVGCFYRVVEGSGVVSI